MHFVLFSLNNRAPYYKTTDAWNMELNKIADGKFNERMEHKLNLKLDLAGCWAIRAVERPGQH